MADAPNEAPKQPGVYHGKPENKKNPHALQGPHRGKPAPHAQKAPLPSGPPPPSQGNSKKPAKGDFKESDPHADAIFSTSVCAREIAIDVRQQPSCSSFPELVSLVYQELAIDATSLPKQWTREAFEYYCTAHLWMRIVHLKAKQRDHLTLREEELVTKSTGFPLNLPEPIRLYLSGLGNVVTKAGEHLKPTFPELPTFIAAGSPGYYGQGPINQVSHNLYEEIPCLGTSITMIRSSLSQIHPLPQPICPVQPIGFTANENLCFWHHVHKPRSEATDILRSAGITEINFPCSPTGTGFNFTLLKSISALIANTSTFKITSVDHSITPESGAIAQTVITRPTANNDQVARSVTAEVEPTCLNQEANGAFGMAIAFGYQLFKEPFEGVNTVWCCVTPNDPDVPIPEDWVLNRNQRRNIPGEYFLRKFAAVSQDAGDFRILTTRAMIKTKR
nr:putative capsid protein [Wuhan Millipede virus 4]